MLALDSFAKYGIASLVVASQASALVPLDLMMHAVDLHAKPDPEQRVSIEEYEKKYPNIKAYNFSVLIDHFHNDSTYAPHSSDSFHSHGDV